jgi:hypothetical protein
MSVGDAQAAYMLLKLSLGAPVPVQQAPTPAAVAPPVFTKTTARAHRKGEKLEPHAVRILKNWIAAHRHRPYPNDVEKMQLMRQTRLTSVQLCNWMSNERRRVLRYGQRRR